MKRPNLPHLKEGQEKYLVIALLGIYFLAALAVSLVRHYSFNSQWYDFGIFDEVVWKFSRFTAPLILPKGGIHIFGDHFSPSVASLAPLYWFFNEQWIIYAAQVLFVVLSAWFLYQIARKELSSVWIRLALLFSFLFFVGMQNALYTDVHYMVFAVLPLSLMFYAVYFNKEILYWASLVYFLGWKENAAGIALGFAIFLLIKQKNKLKGILTALISLAWGILAMKVVIPFFASGVYAYTPTFPGSIKEIVTSLFTPAVKTKTLLISFSSFSFLPLFYPPLWPAIGEQYLERFVLNATGTRWNIGMHYNAILTPLFFISSMEVIKFLKKKLPSYSLIVIASLLVGLTSFNAYFIAPGPLFMSLRPIYYRQVKDNRHYAQFLKKIPKERGLIMVNNNLAAHLTHQDITLLQHGYLKYDPSVVAIYTLDGQNPNNYYPLRFEEVDLFIGSLQNDKNYQELPDVSNGHIFVKR